MSNYPDRKFIRSPFPQNQPPQAPQPSFQKVQTSQGENRTLADAETREISAFVPGINPGQHQKKRARLSQPQKVLLLLAALLVAISSAFIALFEHRSMVPTSASATATRPPVRMRGITPTTGPLQVARNKVAQVMAGMSLDQKLGQLILVEYARNDYQGSGLQAMINQEYVGGVLYQYSNDNFDAPDNTVSGLAAFSAQAQADAKIPLLLGTDQEGGQVNRLSTFHGDLPSAQEMAATGNPASVKAQGAQAARWMLELGMNTDFAPVADVETVEPAILQDRMFGTTPQAVETDAGAYLDGLQQNQVIGTLKHFPGLGAITCDPHYCLPTVYRSLSDLNSIDLAPYKVLIAKNKPAMIMTTDVVMHAIDPNLPAELSSKVITGVLREELGYDGVVVTDGLYMKGISNTWDLGQASAMAIEAGCDLVEGPSTVPEVATVISTLKQALQDGTLTQARVDQSVERILLMKFQYGILK
ncbi:MAG TPA: glycoside hydrolase family 3 N-terminal domain-containing protein [Ktedonobacteraceae bacterium]